MWDGRSSREISDISTNSKSSILLLTSWTAAGLYGPLQDRLGGGDEGALSQRKEPSLFPTVPDRAVD